MKKKISVLLATLVLTLAMGTSAMAAVSPYIVAPEIVELEKGNMNNAEYDTLFKVFGNWLAADGRYWMSSVWDGTDKAVQQNNAALNIVKTYAGITGWERADVIAFMNVGAKNVTAEMWKAGVQVSLMDVPAVGYEKYVVLHVKSDGALEVIPNKVEGGRIIGTFHSLSPVIVIGLKGNFGTNTPANGTTTGTNAGTTAPKTGEQNMAVVYVLAAACLMGALVYVNRKKVTL